MLITILVCAPIRGTSADAWNIAVRTRGVFTHRAGFQHLGGRAWCARRVNYSKASSEPTASPTPEATHQPHHQRQKPRANQASSPGNTTHQPVSTAATTSPATKATHQPHHQHQKPRANQASSHGNTTHQPQQPQHQHQKPHTDHITSPPRQRFLYCDGETPNISLKYFAKYFCVPKPTASETSTTLSPASADNNWAALLSRMVRMNTEGFIP